VKAAGIDIGTTTISGVVLENGENGQAKILEAKTVENGCFIETGNEWERIQYAKEIVERAVNLLDYFLEKYPHVERIGLTGQMHGIVYVDKEGNCVSPLYTWQDARGSIYDGDQIPLTEEIRERCQIHAASGYGLVTHIYNIRHNLVPDSALSFCTIMDYFGMYLTGRKKPLIHVSNAAGLGFFDSRKMCFEKEKLAEMGVDVNWLPDVCTEIEKLGTYRGRTVTTAIGDNQASFLGAAGDEENTLLVNMGTGGQISVLSGQYFSGDGIEARPFLNGKYLLAGASLCGGKAYALLEQFFRKIVKEATGQDQPLYKVMEKMARTGRDLNSERTESRKIKVETTFDGTRMNTEKSGSITQMCSENFTPEDFCYGVLKGMSTELYQMYMTIQKGTGIKIRRMIGSGNGLRKNPVLCEIIEDMFKAELVLAECEEEAATGAAMSSSMYNYSNSTR